MTALFGAAPAHPKVLQCVLRDHASLQAAYIPLFAAGGLFVPTAESYPLGSTVTVLLTLPDGAEHHTLVGRVGWINPPRVAGGREQGIGVRFPETEDGSALRARIESLLGTSLALRTFTQTI